MTITDVLPVDLSERGELEYGTIGLLEVGPQLERHNLVGTQFEHQAAYAGLIASKLGERARAGFDAGSGKAIEITHTHEGVVITDSVTLQRKTRHGVVTGPAFNFISLEGSPGVTLFEFHQFYRHGTDESHSEPRPMDQEIADFLFKIMSSIREPEPAAA